eukprot:CAMPEP_0197915440 /NCGR_PEP_ID=MMETSP1439-20131203/80198_1 /TAXON_ID=66791 /ORGANISM="Gonyaulax spinifera, Strain CCMP409" /LENGTH=62 /DNA_ID=CAMNT_0043537393 /DNA_START=116 /DNA_END=300 /DNA_ORIENTATION=+
MVADRWLRVRELQATKAQGGQHLLAYQRIHDAILHACRVRLREDGGQRLAGSAPEHLRLQDA